MEHAKYLTTRKIGLIITFSALYYILSFLPGIKIGAGAANVSIQIEAFMASIFGFIMGPYLGALTAFMGALLAWILPPGTPSPTSAVFLPSPAINAFVVGLIFTGSWKIALLTLATVISAFWFLPAAQPWDQYSYVGFYVMWDKIAALALIVPSAMLLDRMSKKTIGTRGAVDRVSTIKKIDPAVVLSLAAAALIVANAWLIGLGQNPKIDFNILGTPFGSRLVSKEIFPVVASYGYIWLLLGAGIAACVMMLHFKPSERFVWSASIFLLSCTSAAIGGGFVIGLFLGVLGGILGTLKKAFTLPRITLLEDTLVYFLLAFIGNEADNALGSTIFAVPLVYEGIYQMPLTVLRPLFTVAPLFYFAVRLFQAIITTLVATPLLRNLKAAGFAFGRPAAKKQVSSNKLPISAT